MMVYKAIKILAIFLNNILISHSDRDLYDNATSKEINGKTEKEFYRAQSIKIAEFRAQGVGLVRCSFNPPSPSIPSK